ncbi:MAG TPA: ABC transporter [Ruminococcaceae bacterium]|nr:ABC transporter [Oscillospiraceae bacterium]
MKMPSQAERAVIKKDFREIWDSRMARGTVLAVPLVLVVALPIVFLVMINTVPPSGMNGVDQMMRLLPAQARGLSPRQGMMYLMTDLLFPAFFLMIPLMASSVAAASSFVGEKERGTLPTLLLTPMSVKRIFHAKTLGCVLLSAIVTAISFVVFAVIVSVGDILLGLPFFLNWSWLALILFLTPAVTVFGVVFMVMVSARSKSYVESVQTSGYLVLPIVLVLIGQLAGLFRLSAWFLLVAAAAVWAADALLWALSGRSFTPEKLLR